MNTGNILWGLRVNTSSALNGPTRWNDWAAGVHNSSEVSEREEGRGKRRRRRDGGEEGGREEKVWGGKSQGGMKG